MKEKKIFNLGSEEKFEDCKMIGGNPNGIFNYNRTKHKWAKSLWDNMQERTWFAGHINVSQDKANYGKLSPEVKRTYDLVLAQLITNDSIQTNQLMDKINSYITSPIVNACLAKQAAEECLTEVLTDEGFKPFHLLTLEDNVANYCEDGSIYFAKPTGLTCKVVEDYLYQFSNDDLSYNQKVTPNHRVVHYEHKQNYGKETTYEEEGKLVIKTAEETETGYRKNRFPVSGKLVDRLPTITPFLKQYEDFTLGVVYLLYGIDMEPCNDSSTGFRYTIALSSKRHIEMFKKYLEQQGLVFSVSEYTDPEYGNVVYLFEVEYGKKLDKNLSWVNLKNKDHVWCLSFLRSLQQWHFVVDDDVLVPSMKSEDDDYALFLGTHEAGDKIQALASVCLAKSYTYGRNLYEEDHKNARGYEKHTTNVYSLQNIDKYEALEDPYGDHIDTSIMIVFPSGNMITLDHSYVSGDTINKKAIEYNGKVYCCTVETGMIICKYQRSVFITGNCLHSLSYSIMAEDIAQDTDRIFNMHKHDEELMRKNKAVEEMYNSLYDKEGEPTKEDLLVAFCANQILEELVFPGGFAAMLTIGEQMTGSSQMIAEIMKDK